MDQLGHFADKVILTKRHQLTSPHKNSTDILRKKKKRINALVSRVNTPNTAPASQVSTSNTAPSAELAPQTQSNGKSIMNVPYPVRENFPVKVEAENKG